jgi:hypothetical protein
MIGFAFQFRLHFSPTRNGGARKMLLSSTQRTEGSVSLRFCLTSRSLSAVQAFIGT